MNKLIIKPYYDSKLMKMAICEDMDYVRNIFMTFFNGVQIDGEYIKYGAEGWYFTTNSELIFWPGLIDIFKIEFLFDEVIYE